MLSRTFTLPCNSPHEEPSTSFDESLEGPAEGWGNKGVPEEPNGHTVYIGSIRVYL